MSRVYLIHRCAQAKLGLPAHKPTEQKSQDCPQESRCQKGEPSVFNEQAYARHIRSAEEPFEKELEEAKNRSTEAR
jgi:hypothetical protein